MLQAFSNALERARGMGGEQMQRALAEAEKFGDDQGQRAIETAMLEKGRIDLLRTHLGTVNPDRLAALDQLDDARRAVQRTRVEDGFAWQAFGAPKPPQEVARIPEFADAQGIDPASGLRRVVGQF